MTIRPGETALKDFRCPICGKQDWSIFMDGESCDRMICRGCGYEPSMAERREVGE